MKEYVLGFCFDESKKYVLLIQKTKPEWQKGRLNAIGGKVEPGERPVDTMVREFHEEASLSTCDEDWRQFATLGAGEWQMYCFAMFDQLFFLKAHKSPTEEKVGMYETASLNSLNVLPNLHWLLPMALEGERFSGEVGPRLYDIREVAPSIL